MAELVLGRPLVEVEYVPSLGLDVLSTLHLVSVAHDFEGLSEWLIEADAALSEQLRHDITLAFRFAAHGVAVIEELAGALLMDTDAPAHTSAAALFQALDALTAEQARDMLAGALNKAAERYEIALDQPSSVILADQERLQALLAQLGAPVDYAEAAALLQDPATWCKLLAASARQFWDQIYRTAYNRRQQQRERNATYHRCHAARPNFYDLFTAVTGRMLPEHIEAKLSSVQKVRFVPSLHLGPYLTFLFNAGQMTVFYDSSTTPSQEDDFEERVQSLYMPLEALADKTRLQIMALLHGRELYAQEIVDRLAIHQSAVSRHLKLMETSGILSVRRERGAKYYSINREAIDQLRARLAELI